MAWDRQALTRHIFALLVDVAVDDKVDDVSSNAGRIDERCSLGCGRIGGDRGSLGLQTPQERRKIPLQHIDLGREIAKIIDRIDPARGFMRELILDAGAYLLFRFDVKGAATRHGSRDA